MDGSYGSVCSKGVHISVYHDGECRIMVSDIYVSSSGMEYQVVEWRIRWYCSKRLNKKCN